MLKTQIQIYLRKKAKEVKTSPLYYHTIVQKMQANLIFCSLLQTNEFDLFFTIQFDLRRRYSIN